MAAHLLVSPASLPRPHLALEPVVNMTPDETIVTEDLAYITSHGRDEFARLAGRHLVVAGGAGFLGYYLVQALLHWNKTHPRSTPISVTVLDSFVRGVPKWLTALQPRPDLSVLQHDITNPLPEGLGDVQYLIHAASIASPIYYRKYPIETMDANVNGLRFLLEYCLAQQKKGQAIEGDPVLLQQRDLRRSHAGEHPDARDLSRLRVVHGSAGVLRRIEAVRRDAVREFCSAARPAHQGRSAFQQLRSRAEDYRRARHPRLRAEHP